MKSAQFFRENMTVRILASFSFGPPIQIGLRGNGRNRKRGQSILCLSVHIPRSIHEFTRKDAGFYKSKWRHPNGCRRCSTPPSYLEEFVDKVKICVGYLLIFLAFVGPEDLISIYTPNFPVRNSAVRVWKTRNTVIIF